MSELKNIQAGDVTFKWQLLATVSMVALAGAVCASGQTKAAVNDDDRSTVWIELGGQLESVSAGEKQFVPPFIVATPRPGPEKISPLGIPHAPRHSFGGEGKITFEPGHDGWVFSAAARYGRSEAKQHLRQQSYPTQPILPTYGLGTAPVFQRALPFSDVEARSSESHAVMDFQVGRDVGVGLLGSGTRSTFNLGVRFAQFGSRSNVAFKSDPDAHPTFKYFPNGAKIVKGAIYHSNAAAGSAIRNFHGVGPSIAWNASAGIAGTNEEGKILLDWGVNAAVLFGRQKAVVHHQTTALYHHGA